MPNNPELTLSSGKGYRTCVVCGAVFSPAAHNQSHCKPCSNEARKKRKAQWTRSNANKTNERLLIRRSEVINLGDETSKKNASSIAWVSKKPDLIWLVKFFVPFTYSVSKNSALGFNRYSGRKFVYKKAQKIRDDIAMSARHATKDINIKQGKLWLDILVQKPNHRGDAVNVIDSVCDGIKVGIGLDDRWYCIKSLDWEICKKEPRLYIGIGQSIEEHTAVCSYCGQIKSITDFNKNINSSPLGIGRECKDCRRIGRKPRDAVKVSGHVEKKGNE